LGTKKQKYTVDEALERLQDYCAKQERSGFQVEKKLFDWGIPAANHDDVIFELIQENFLNEERFSQAYAQSKMRMNQWGRLKIKNGLQQHRISNYNIDTALQSLNDSKYDQNIEDLVAKKGRCLSTDLPSFEKRQKIIRFLLQRGFIMSEIQPHLENLD